MAIVPIPNQPININPYTWDTCARGEEAEYCALKTFSDPFDIQFRQTPCGPGRVTNPEFSIYSDNLVTNSDFSAGSSSWIADPAITVTDKATWVPSPGGVPDIRQAISLTVSQNYIITFTLSARTAGSVTVLVGGTSAGVFTTNGTFSVNVIAGGSGGITFTGTDDYDGSLDNVYLVAAAIDWTNDGTWTIGGSQACSSPGTAGTISCDATTYAIPVSGIFVKVEIHIEGRTTGSIQVKLYDQLVATITDAKITTVYPLISAVGNNLFEIIKDDTFDGCVTYAQSWDLRNDYTALLVEKNSGIVVVDLTSMLYYVDDTVSMVYSLGSSVSVSEGCYRVQIIDPCGQVAGDADEMVDDEGFDVTLGWVVANAPTYGGTIAITGSSMQLTTGASASSGYGIGLYTYSGPGYYRIRFTFTTGSWGSSAGLSSVFFYLPNGTGATTYIVATNILPSTSYDITKTVYIDSIVGSQLYGTPFNNNYAIGIQIYAGGSAGEVNQLLSFQAAIESLDQSAAGVYLSNCINIKESHACTKLIEGQCETGTKNGFLFWDTDYLGFASFKLSQRIKGIVINPEYKLNGEIELNTSGEKELKWGQREKFYTAIVGDLSETEIDSLTTQMMCDDFTIDGRAFVPRMKDVSPTWDPDGTESLSLTKFELDDKEGTIFYKK